MTENPDSPFSGKTAIINCQVCKSPVAECPADTLILIAEFGAICKECWGKSMIHVPSDLVKGRESA